jgi:hypothetical protein
VHKSHVIIALKLALSEKQIPLYNVVGVVKTHFQLFEQLQTLDAPQTARENALRPSRARYEPSA